MPCAVVIGGGLAGLAAATVLGHTGWNVDVLEARPFFGGRATSWPVPAGEEGESEVIDNCQHVLLRCCVNLLDFYKRLGVTEQIQFYRNFVFLEPGGRVSTMRRGVLPAPAHFATSFLRMKCFTMWEKIAIARAMLAIPKERERKDLDDITMLDWLREKRQPERAITRFWNQVLVSAVNEDLDRLAASHGFQVFWLGMLAKPDSYELGIPTVPLRQLYRSSALEASGLVTLHERAPVTRFNFRDQRVQCVETETTCFRADAYISALPFDRLPQVAPEAPVDTSAFTHSPITGIHLWFDRPITELPHATLLDRTIQWMFNKHEGRYVQVVVSASRSLVSMSKQEIVDLAVAELAEFFPAVRDAKLERSQVIKEVRATFSAVPGLEQVRPAAQTSIPNFFLAGDWTRSGWPATMEGAVRSGYLAAEAAVRSVGLSDVFLIPDIA